MTQILAGAFGFLAALAAHDLAAQALADNPLRPLSGTCPRCGTNRGWLKARCPTCSRPVAREVGVVLAGVVGAMAFVNTIGVSWALVSYLGFLLLSLALVITDIEAMRIVDRLNIRGTLLLVVALGAGAALDGNLGSFWRALLGALAYFAGTNLVFIVVRGRGFGYGDVKLSIQLGLFTAYVSWGTLGWSVFLMAMIGGVISIGVIVVGSVARRQRLRSDPDDEAPTLRDALRVELPYGPAMVAGAWIALALAGIGAFPIPS